MELKNYVWATFFVVVGMVAGSASGQPALADEIPPQGGKVGVSVGPDSVQLSGNYNSGPHSVGVEVAIPLHGGSVVPSVGYSFSFK